MNAVAWDLGTHFFLFQTNTLRLSSLKRKLHNKKKRVFVCTQKITATRTIHPIYVRCCNPAVHILVTAAYLTAHMKDRTCFGYVLLCFACSPGALPLWLDKRKPAPRPTLAIILTNDSMWETATQYKHSAAPPWQLLPSPTCLIPIFYHHASTWSKTLPCHFPKHLPYVRNLVFLQREVCF
jgi:hypothetical protein